MTARRFVEDLCWASGKHRYSTRQAAQTAATARARCGITLTVYWCRGGCCGYHLTSEGLPEQRRAR